MTSKPATPGQKRAVHNILPPDERGLAANLSFGEAVRTIGCGPYSWRAGRVTLAQGYILNKHGLWRPGLNCGDAWDWIAEIHAELDAS
jgi:hypothetical protein